MKTGQYADVVVRRRQEIEATQLTEEEKEQAILNAKIHKWSEERNREYWAELEAKKPKEQ